MKSKPLKNAV